MSKNHKLQSVIRHEFLTIIKQPSFWISLVAFPLLIGVVLLIGALTNTDDEEVSPGDENISVAVIDQSSVIDPSVSKGFGLTLKNADQQSQLIESVKQGEIDGLIVYPENLVSSNNYQVYADNTDDDNSAVVGELGRITLQQSILASVESDELKALALNGGQAEVQAFEGGEEARGFSEYIVPGAFLVLFYTVLIFSVGYALTSISEEKENRSIEMVLSYVKPKTLILGKLYAIILLTLTQIMFIAIMAAIAYGVARWLGNDLTLPFSVSDLVFVPIEIVIGLGFLVFGFTFFVGLMAMVGAIFPSSKEAAGFSTVFYLLPAIPFWGIDAILNQPSNLFTQILTYFPLTSPTTVLLRNAAGNLSPAEGLISLAILIVSTFIIIAMAAKAFKLGTLEYKDRIKFSSLIKK